MPYFKQLFPGAGCEIDPRGLYQRKHWSNQVLGLALVLALLGLLAGRYLLAGGYLDHIESTVIVAGWQYLQGSPLYSIDAGQPAFAVFYGPLAFLAPLPFAAITGGTVWGSKLAPVLAMAGTVGLMAWHFFRRGWAGPAVTALFYLAAGLLMMYPASIWLRPDPFEVFLVAAAVAASRARFGPAIVGICLGLAVNFKIHAFAYFLAILADAWDRGGWRALACATGVSCTVFAIPFLLPGISFGDYAGVLVSQVGGRPPTAKSLFPNLICAYLLAAPLVLALAKTGTATEQPAARYYAIATLLTLVLLLYPASYPGAGPYHFLPLVPVLADALFRLGQRLPGIAAAPYFMLAFFAVQQLLAAQWLPNAPIFGQGLEAGARRAEEARALASQMPGDKVQVGFGDNLPSYKSSQTSRAVLAMAGHPARFDAQVLMELKQIGVDGSARLIPRLASCEVRLWLLPAGERPFLVPSYYGGGTFFSDEFRRAFHENYRLDRTVGSYDLWVCSHPPP